MKIAVVGLGYVGLPLAHAFSSKFQVIGFDINEKRVAELNNGVDVTLELGEEEIKSVLPKFNKDLKDNYLTLSGNIEDIKDCNIYIVTVPTPINKMQQPDLTPLIKSSQTVGQVLKKDDIVIYESTVYPGVTEEVCVPELEIMSGLTFNKDFFCGYSPERINPGDKERTVTKILKITSGSTPEIADKVDALYSSIITAGTYRASSIKVAEAAKVIENTQRDVNIALINELALIFDNIGIDTSEVIEAAATKWNFIKLQPGLVGGHCIGVDPYYLVYKAEELGYKPNLILGARQLNNGMGKYVAEKTIKYLIKGAKLVKDSNILVMGLTFKENCPDVRNTRVIDIIDELIEYSANIDIWEPWIEDKDRELFSYKFVKNPFKNKAAEYDAVIVAVGHEEFKNITPEEYKSLMRGTPIIIDVKGIVPNATWKL